jgi:hypothetical protein
MQFPSGRLVVLVAPGRMPSQENSISRKHWSRQPKKLLADGVFITGQTAELHVAKKTLPQDTGGAAALHISYCVNGVCK